MTVKLVARGRAQCRAVQGLPGLRLPPGQDRQSGGALCCSLVADLARSVASDYSTQRSPEMLLPHKVWPKSYCSKVHALLGNAKHFLDSSK